MKYRIIGDMGKTLATIDNAEYSRHEDGFWSFYDSSNHLLHTVKDVFVVRIETDDEGK